MEIIIKSIHFDATEKLKAFVNKKVEKLQKTYGDIKKVEVQLKVEKPATALNKSTSILVSAFGQSFFTEKTYDTFEEGISSCIDAMKVQIIKTKDKLKNQN